MGKNRNHDLPYGVIVTGVQLSGMRLCVTPLGKVPSPVEVLGVGWGEREREREKGDESQFFAIRLTE